MLYIEFTLRQQIGFNTNKDSRKRKPMTKSLSRPDKREQRCISQKILCCVEPDSVINQYG